MPPTRVVIIRHGERIDHVHPKWCETAEMPNDPPLTDNGKAMARELGVYLARRPVLPEHRSGVATETVEKDPRSIAAFHPDNVIILASPMIRCIQTAHHIREGLLWTHGEDPETAAGKVPIYPEEAMVEPGYQQHMEYMRNPNNVVALPGGPDDQLWRELRVRAPRTPHGGVYRSARLLQEDVSPHVVVPEVPPPCMSLLLPDASGPLVKYDASAQEFLDVMGVEERMQQALRTLFASSSSPSSSSSAPSSLPPHGAPWDGKTVLLVGHGTTAVAARKVLTGASLHRRGAAPHYTGFAEFYSASSSDAVVTPPVSSTVDDATTARWLPAPQAYPFHTPHLDATQR